MICSVGLIVAVLLGLLNSYMPWFWRSLLEKLHGFEHHACLQH